jgi:hypothetical protein
MNGARASILAGALAMAGFALAGFTARDAAAAEEGLNACGCRQSAQGLCVCEKKSKCGCPGECEPNGCEERRAKQMEKEIQAETKKAEDAARKQNRSHTDSDDQGGDEATPKSSAARGSKAAGASKSAAVPKSTVSKMTAAQKKDLARLLGLYLAEHPNDGDRPIEQVRSDVSR